MLNKASSKKSNSNVTPSQIIVPDFFITSQTFPDDEYSTDQGHSTQQSQKSAFGKRTFTLPPVDEEKKDLEVGYGTREV